MNSARRLQVNVFWRNSVDIKALVNYHVQKNETQSFQFDADGIQGNLISPELIEKQVIVRDVNGNAATYNLADDGIMFLSNKLSQYDYNKQAEVDTYEQDIIGLLQQNIGAKEVLVFDHTIRIDQIEALRKPARNVHNDYSEKSAHIRLEQLLGKEKALEYAKGEYGFVNVWRPIDSVIKTSPLGFIKSRSMRPSDWLNIELIYPDRQGQILGVVANPEHEWFYMSEMTLNNLIVFNIYNNKGKPHLAHSALDIIGQNSTNTPRKSIETRTLVRY